MNGAGPVTGGHVDCEQVLNRIHEFLDHELDEATGDEIRQHIADCEPCLDEVEVDSALKALINRVCLEEKAPAGLRERCSAEALRTGPFRTETLERQ